MKCPYCGTDNSAGETFCTNCGGYLDATNSSPTIVSNSGNVTSTSSTGTTSAGATTVSGTSGTLTPNTRVQNGRYIVDKILGQGGMGAAVLARDTRVSNKTVVIKELISDSSDPTQLQADVRNFEREVETLANVDHPLIPTVTDSFQEGSHYFMVQEYVAGENLESRMERVNQPMPEQEALAYTSQVLDILDYLGQQTPPIVHRDIKPANIIIGSRDKRAHLVDFGIARADEAKHSQRKQTSALGTPGYAPPEQYQGNADGRSDLYALAATLHHLLTNRDPRNYPPFSYPPVRSLNPKLSPDIQSVLERALSIDITKRYQNAAEMKRVIDAILMDRFSSSPDTSNYMRGASGPMTPIPRTATASGAKASAPAPIHQPNPVTPPPPPPPQYATQRRGANQPTPQQAGIYAQPPAPQKRGGGGMMRNFLLLVVVVVLIAAVLILVPRFTRSGQTGNNNSTPTVAGSTPAPTIPVASNGIGVSTMGNELIGISDGTYSFDNNRADGQVKSQAAQSLKGGDSSRAQSLWRSGLATDTNDGEANIYLENQRVLASGRPYITVVVATMLTGSGDIISVGRDNLQGAYVAQKEFNANGGQRMGGTLVRMLVANTGSKTEYATSVANQIVTATQNDKTIIGVSGWPYSSRAQNAVPILSRAKIPSISSTASSDDLTGISPYFFRVAPSDTSQAGVGAKFAQQVLQSKNVAIFVDPSDAYSRSLADGFKKQFSGNILVTENYTVGDSQSVSTALQQAIKQVPGPDLIYFAGYSNDVSVILSDLPQDSKVQVLGGDALYNLGGYPQSARAGFNRLRFTAFAYPDEWSVLGYNARKPAFYTDYAAAFDPSNKRQNQYGFSRAAYNVVLSYDATLALLTASGNVLSGGQKNMTPQDLQQALSKITGSQAIQGASGQISFNADGNPVDKAVLILKVSSQGYIQMDSKLGAGKLLV